MLLTCNEKAKFILSCWTRQLAKNLGSQLATIPLQLSEDANGLYMSANGLLTSWRQRSLWIIVREIFKEHVFGFAQLKIMEKRTTQGYLNGQSHWNLNYLKFQFVKVTPHTLIFHFLSSALMLLEELKYLLRLEENSRILHEWVRKALIEFAKWLLEQSHKVMKLVVLRKNTNQSN